MDATTIQEIANQLGIAVDKVAELIPQVTQAHIWSDNIVISICAVVFILALGGFIGSMIYKNKVDKWSEAYIIFACILVLTIAIVAFILCVVLPDIYCWMNFPEAKFLDYILGKI